MTGTRKADGAVGTPVSTRAGLGLLALTGVLWGSIGVTVRLLQDHHVPTLAISFWRFVCACAVLLPVMGPRGLRRLRLELRTPGRLLGICAGSVVFQLTFFFAVDDLGAAPSTLITLGLAPVALMAGRSVRTRTVPPAATLLVFAIALVGLGLVTAGGAHAGTGHHPTRGIVEAVASGLAYAASTAFSAPLSARLAPTAITFSASFAGLVVLAPFLAVQGWHVPATTGDVAGVLWLGVVTTVLAYAFFYTALRTVPGHTAMIVTLLEPATAVVLAAAVLDEPLTATNVVGAVLLLSAVALLFLTAPPALVTDEVPG